MNTTSAPYANTVAALEPTANVRHTQCGTAKTVWHIWGQPTVDHPPVVLLHGGSGSWTHWVRNIQALVDAGHHVLVPDLPGFGDSDVPDHGRDVDAMGVPLEQGLCQLVGYSECQVVGFSFGAASAVLWAEQMSERFDRLVMIGAPGFGINHPDTALRAWRELKDPVAQRATQRHNLSVLMLHSVAAIDEQAIDLHYANVVRDRLPYRRQARKPILLDALPQVQCPVYGIYGQEDVLYAGRQALLESTVRGCTPTLQSFEFIPGAGHWVQYEQAEAFNAALLNALVSP